MATESNPNIAEPEELIMLEEEGTPVFGEPNEPTDEQPVPAKKKRTRTRHSKAAKKEKAPAEPVEEEPAPPEEPDEAPLAEKPADTPAATKPAPIMRRQDYIAERLEARDQRQEAATTVGIFVSSLRSKTMLESKISGVEIDGDHVYWVCYENSVTIRIPFEESYMTIPAELKAPIGEPIPRRLLARRQQFLAKAIGATIPYILTSMVSNPDGTFTALASRAAALARIRSRYYGPNALRPLEVGVDVNAKVLSVGDYGLYVCAFGFDLRVPNWSLTHRFTQDVSAVYQPDDTIRLRLVKINETGGIPELYLSGRPIELEKFKPNLKRLKIDKTRGRFPRYGGTITTVRMDRSDPTIPRVLITLFLDGIEVPAFSRDPRLHLRNELHTGDSVIFEVKGTTPQGYAYGDIIRFTHGR